jgi:hypothetical protein
MINRLLASNIRGRRQFSVSSFVRWWVTIMFLIVAAVTPQLTASDLQLVGKRSALIGSAYASDKEHVVGGQCVEGTTVPTGAPDSALAFDQNISESRLAEDLGFHVGGRARLGVVEANLAADFLSRSVHDSFSLSAIYEAHYNLAPQKLVTSSLHYTAAGTQAKANNFAHWAETCGDMFVDEMQAGGKLFYSIRVDFSSAEEKKEFSAHFSLSTPLLDTDNTLKMASERLSKNVKVTVSAYQIGGDETKLSTIFGTSEAGRNQFVQCAFGSLDNCAHAIQNALAYEADVTTGFPSQLAVDAKPGPGILSYGLSKYTAYGIYSGDNSLVAEAAELARKGLSGRFEETYIQSLTVARLLKRSLTPSRKSLLEAASKDINTNLAAVIAASDACYDRPASCPAVVMALRLKDIDPDILRADSFSALCIEALDQTDSTPVRLTIDVLVQSVDNGGSLRDATDCRVYERLLRNMRILELNGKHLANLEPLAGLTDLQRLSMDDNDITDLSPLADLRELEFLFLTGNRITDLSPLVNLWGLEDVSLAANRVKDVRALAGLQEMKTLNLSENRIESVKPLSGLQRLQMLGLQSNDLKVLNDLTDLPRLNCASIGLNHTTPAEDMAFKKAFPTVKIEVLASPPIQLWFLPCLAK